MTCAVVGMRLQEEVVQQGCGAGTGRWSCLSHGQTFRSAHEKNIHVDRELPGQRHVLVWLCDLHGPEAPERRDKP